MSPRQLIIGVAVMAIAALAMVVFTRREQKRAVQTEAAASYSRPVAPPPSGPTEQATLYVAYDDAGALLPQDSIIPLSNGRQQRAEELLRALMDIYVAKSSPHAMGPGADIRNVYLVDPGLAVIDLNAAFASGHRSGILVEELTITSLVETLTTNIPGITRVKILVDGKEQETLAGHVDLSRFYEVSSAGDVLNQMRSQ
jgi:hypothetical protein